MRLKDLTTLIYVTSEDECLFIRKTSEDDINYAKYLGIGGHFETDESPEECVLRELYEEAGIKAGDLTDFRYRGLVTFVSKQYDNEYMHVFTASLARGLRPASDACDEGELFWVPVSEIMDLPVWEGDKLMFAKLFSDDRRFFTMKLSYDGDKLVSHTEAEY